MGQSEILKILEKNKGKWISTIQISLKLNQTVSVIARALNKMFYYRELERTKFPMKENSQRYVFFWSIK